jgi:hypothetical protein
MDKTETLEKRIEPYTVTTVDLTRHENHIEIVTDESWDYRLPTEYQYPEARRG